jgi:tetratricopeptide (TPR) repeat protein
LALLNWAKSLLSAESPAEAESPLREAMAIAEELGSQEDYREALDLLTVSLGLRSGQLGESGRYEEAIPVITETVQLCRELGDPERLAKALAGLSIALDRADRPQEAQATARDALRVASSSASPQVQRQIKGAIGALAEREVDASGSMELESFTELFVAALQGQEEAELRKLGGEVLECPHCGKPALALDAMEEAASKGTVTVQGRQVNALLACPACHEVWCGLPA